MNKQIKDYQNYSISNEGVVTNINTNRALKPDILRGYERVKLGRYGGKYSIHRLVAEAFLANPNNKPQVNHINGIKDDNRVENLEWCTAKENIYHAQSTGLMNTRQYPIKRRQKISIDDASELCEAFCNGVGAIDIAKYFNVTRGAIYAILNKSEITRREYVIQ